MNIDGNWEVFHRNEPKVLETIFKISPNIPSYLVVDNFYENPHLVREHALKQVFHEHETYHKGLEQIFISSGRSS